MGCRFDFQFQTSEEVNMQPFYSCTLKIEYREYQNLENFAKRGNKCSSTVGISEGINIHPVGAP